MGARAAAAAVLPRVLHHNVNRPNALPSNVNALTDVVVAHLDACRLQNAISVVSDAPAPFPYFLYARLFQICSSNHAITEVRLIKSHLITFCPVLPAFLLNRAIEACGKCGSLTDARELFDEMPQRDGGSWNAMITTYAQSGCADQALCLFKSMLKSGVPANEITFSSALASCAVLLALSLSRQLHGLIAKHGFYGNVILKSSLVDIYGKCWHIGDARRVFDEIQCPTVVSWDVIVRRYFKTGNGSEAVLMFFRMIEANVSPSSCTFSSALLACSIIHGLKEGTQIHGVAIKIGIEKDEMVFSSLVDMYVTCRDLESACRIFEQTGSKNLFTRTSMLSGYAMSGRIGEARQLFDEMPDRSVLSWNAMLSGYVRSFQWEEALKFFCQMRETTKDIDSVTLGLILNVCSGLSDIGLGKHVHGFVYRHNFSSSLSIGNSLLNMYGKCGDLRSARVWFCEMCHHRDRLSWNALLNSYACHKLSGEAITIFSYMQWEATPNKFTFAILLAACSDIFALNLGKQIHGFMIRHGSEMDVVVRSALVDMYSKCRFLEYAVKVFRVAGSRDVVLWNSMVLGCCHNRRGRLALEVFDMMGKEGVKPDHVTFQGLLFACVIEGLVDLGRKYFDSMSNEYCIIPRLKHYECMIKLYGKHGFLDELADFIKSMPFDPTVSMLTKVLDACRDFGNSKLGEWASKRLHELNPPVLSQFKVIDGAS